METFSALLALCAGNSQVTGEFPAQRPLTRIFAVFFDLRLNKRLSKQWWGWWFETPSRSLWRHCNGIVTSFLAALIFDHRVTNLIRSGLSGSVRVAIDDWVLWPLSPARWETAVSSGDRGGCIFIRSLYRLSTFSSVERRKPKIRTVTLPMLFVFVDSRFKLSDRHTLTHLPPGKKWPPFRRR